MSETKNQLLSREISRKQFLQLAAGSGLAVMGLGNFLSFFHNVTKPTPVAVPEASKRHGFGSSKFGV
jgi:hypothetical protein